MSAVRLDDPWIQAPLTGFVFVVIYVALGVVVFNESPGESAVFGGIGGVIFTFVYGVYLNRIR